MAEASSAADQLIEGADGAKIKLATTGDALRIEYSAPAPGAPAWERTIFIALDLGGSEGSAVLPFEEKLEGSTVFLPFRANKFYALQAGTKSNKEWHRTFEKWSWGERVDASKELVVQFDEFDCRIELPLDELGTSGKIKLAIYSKDFTKNSWGRLFAASDAAVRPGEGDKYIPHYWEVDLKARKGAPLAARKGRLTTDAGKLRIYQMFPRLFGNTNETRKPNGTITENGVGRFNDINAAALASLQEFGFTHIWLTGVLQQATATDYSSIGQPPDDPDLLKGLAGSPYAIKDYFDVSPDYAEQPEKRIEEFKALLKRVRDHGMRTLIDFVPNHVARSYASDVKPEFDFGAKGRDGAGDDTSKYFDPENNFFYLKPGAGGPPLRLPTVKDGQAISPTCKVAGQQCDGLFDPEKEHGKVTGNNKATWTPDLGDWYETVKLNYGYDFTDAAKKVREYPNALTPDKPVPDTWKKMDRVLEYWQSLGVDGFRCDMAHMEPPEFWAWAIARARERQPDVVFIAEAYDNDPAKVPGSDPVVSQLNGGKSNVMFDLLNAGFTAVYDDPTYKVIKKIYDGPGWANDIDGARPDEFIFDNSLRYAENHDEVRLAAKKEWGGVGMKVGPAVSAILYGLSRGPAMLYNGQEVGEPAAGVEGFGGDDARTSIFDYWSMPELVKWTNGHKFDGAKLSPEQKALRSTYGRLIKVLAEPAFRDGECLGLNASNRDNPKYGRVANEQPSGHWIYSFLRYDAATGQRFLGVVNLNPTTALKDVSVTLDARAIEFLGLSKVDPKTLLTLGDKLAAKDPASITSSIDDAGTGGIRVGDLAPATPLLFEVKADIAKP
ncbi:MAG: GH13_38 / GH13 [uncultured Chthoniobacterales bacterium]|uniref:GH13_38 / GH13 n=1 Tax=uncultured Chthoniobacterales bacterium TaxID=1836801 RepID=A0A6J4HWT7_9BACT|nr:MAG: GH13_38 / GH13 [uncultured Chthoniobacterales bacterium]